MRKLLVAALLLAASGPVQAWNNTGHMVTARLAWKKLTAPQRAEAVSILKNHPHYDEFLATDRPDGFSEDEWVFLRAATWPDWVRGHHKDYHHGPWHYINYPFVPPGSRVDPADHMPAAADKENIVYRLPASVALLKNGSREARAISLCWVLHLVGDIHQPLHSTALFSERYPDGDQGGNLAFIRIRSGRVRLHAFWDGLLGKSETPASIGRNVKEIEDLLAADPERIKKDIEQHRTAESWAKESAEIARKACYLNGELQVARPDEEAPQAPDSYARDAGRTARIQVGKAGQRLADLLAGALAMPERAFRQDPRLPSSAPRTQRSGVRE